MSNRKASAQWKEHFFLQSEREKPTSAARTSFSGLGAAAWAWLDLTTDLGRKFPECDNTEVRQDACRGSLQADSISSTQSPEDGANEAYETSACAWETGLNQLRGDAAGLQVSPSVGPTTCRPREGPRGKGHSRWPLTKQNCFQGSFDPGTGAMGQHCGSHWTQECLQCPRDSPVWKTMVPVRPDSAWEDAQGRTINKSRCAKIVWS